MDRRSNRVVISARDLAQISSWLTDLVQNGNALCALLLDSSGQIIRACGETKGLDTVILGALLAGNFGSAREIARLLKEESFTALIQQGERSSVYTHLVGNRWMLSVVFDRRTQVGLIKSLTQRCAGQVAELLKPAASAEGPEGQVVSKEWRQAAHEALSQLLDKGQAGG